MFLLTHSFIAKTNTNKNAIPNGDTSTVNTNNNNNSSSAEDTHTCFVFVSSKLASDITMTIGQAFDLAYRRYVSDGSKTTEMSKMQTQHKQLEHSVAVYQQRLKDLVELLPKAELTRLLSQYGVRDLLEVTPLPVENGSLQNHVATINGHKTPEMGMYATCGLSKRVEPAISCHPTETYNFNHKNIPRRFQFSYIPSSRDCEELKQHISLIVHYSKYIIYISGPTKPKKGSKQLFVKL